MISVNAFMAWSISSLEAVREWVFVVSLESKVENFFQFTCFPGEGGEDVMGDWKTPIV